MNGTRVVVVAVSLAFCCASMRAEQPPQKAKQTHGPLLLPKPVAPEVKPMLIYLRRGEGGRFNPGERTTGYLGPLLQQVLVKGSTTQAQVTRLFGRSFENLDRPERDAITSIEYVLGGAGASVSIVLDFEGARPVLSDWSLSYAICGFCPHVYADDGSWRLEGKMLAGCIGAENEGADTLLLPRLKPQKGRLRVKLANLAPEVEYIDVVQLGVVDLDVGEELDVDTQGQPVAWRPVREARAGMVPKSDGKESFSLDLERSGNDTVLVFEARNTSAFERAMRRFVFGEDERPPQPSLSVAFDDGTRYEVPPVGTKFLRRIVVPAPAEARSLRVDAAKDLWLVRRIWVGVGRKVGGDVTWQSPLEQSEGDPASAGALVHRDGQRLRLERMQEVELSFAEPPAASGGGRRGYVLRMSGYYEFLPDGRFALGHAAAKALRAIEDGEKQEGDATTEEEALSKP